MTETLTAFFDGTIIASGSRAEVARRIVEGHGPADHTSIQVFDDQSGKPIDLDYRASAHASSAPHQRGRPRLGVEAREITLLPRHWEWLGAQTGGASAALRRLVDDARRNVGTDQPRRDAAYHFMQSTCGDRPGYEEALRALYRDNRAGFAEIVAAWPEDVRTYLNRLLAG